jgi:hypothetical protein
MFLTLTVSIDYQRSASTLWDSVRMTWEDMDARWVFSPAEIEKRDHAQLVAALAKHRLSRKQEKDAGIWRTVALSFLSLFHADPRKLLKHTPTMRLKFTGQCVVSMAEKRTLDLLNAIIS